METILAWIAYGLFVAFGHGQARGFLPNDPPPGYNVPAPPTGDVVYRTHGTGIAGPIPSWE